MTVIRTAFLPSLYDPKLWTPCESAISRYPTFIAPRRKLKIEALARVSFVKLQVVKQRRFHHPPKDADQEVGRKLQGSIERRESGS